MTDDVPYTVTPVAGLHGSISPSVPQVVGLGRTTSFTVIPDKGYRIETVTGCGGTLSGDKYTTGPITAGCTVTASFVIKTYTTAVTAETGGSITPTGIVSASHGSARTFTIIASATNAIADVKVDGASVGAVSSYTFTNITDDHTISAVFTLNTMTITASAGANGSITPSGEVNVLAGTNKIFTITPNSGYKTAAVLVDGVNKGALTSYTFINVTGNHTISASFSPTITSTSGLNGNIYPKGITTIPDGTDKNYTITPTPGYHVADVLVDNVSVGAVTTYTFTSVTTPHTISVTFAVNQ